MPRIPSILADENLRVGPQSPSASAVPSGFEAVSSALSQASGTLSDVATTRQNLDKQRQRAESARWVADNLYQERDHLNKWQSQKENNTSENYADNFKTYAEERIKLYQSAAPSKEARDAITVRLQDFANARYNEALGVTERTRLEQSKNSVINQISFTLETFRNAQSVPGNDALGETEVARLDIRDNIDQMFGTMPDVARKLKAHTDTEIALGVAPADEDLAKNIINESTDIDNADKPALLYKVDAMSRASKNTLQDQTDRVRRDHLSAVEAGNAHEKLPLKFYSVYEDPKHEKEKDDFRIEVLTDTHAKVVELAPLNETATIEALSKMAKAVKTERQSLVYQATQKQLSDIAKLRDKDRVSWLREYNPEIKTIEQQLAGLDPQSDEYKTLLTQRNDSILKYQGFPPKDYTGYDKHQFLGLATNDRQLMTLAEAQDNATTINRGTPGETIKLINQVLAQYPDPDHQNIAFNNMVGLPGATGIKEEYQLLWQNKDQWFAESFAKSVSDQKAVASLDETKRKEMDDSIEANSTWKQFESAMVAGGRSQEAAAFKKGISAYAAQIHVSDKQGLKDSTGQAIRHLLSSTLGFTSVNGRSLIIQRDKSDGKSKRSDDEIHDLGRRLTVSLRTLDPRAIDQSKFSGLDALHPDKKNLGRLQAVRDIITRTGFFVNEGDGQSVTLYVVGDDGQTFQLRDEKNRAFQIYFDQLPNFSEYDPSFVREFTGAFRSDSAAPLKALPQKTYPLQQGYGPGVSYFDQLLGWPEKQTNWPIDNVFKRKEVK